MAHPQSPRAPAFLRVLGRIVCPRCKITFLARLSPDAEKGATHFVGGCPFVPGHSVPRYAVSGASSQRLSLGGDKENLCHTEPGQSPLIRASRGEQDRLQTTQRPIHPLEHIRYRSAAKTEPAAPAPTTMKSYRFSSFDPLITLNSQDLKSDFCDGASKVQPLSRTDCRCATPVLFHR